MAYISFQPRDFFNTVLWTGNGSTQSITGVDFQPDLVWTKGRSDPYDNTLTDAVRGATKYLISNSTNAEGTGNIVTSFDSDGFTLGNRGEANNNSSTYVAWNWLANGSGSSNTDGSITSTVSASTTSGFSIVSYTGTGSNATVGHGLGATPKFIIIKNRDEGAAFWSVINPRSTSTTDTNILYLNKTNAEADDTNVMGTNLPNSTTFGIGTYTGVNVNGNNHIAYCFAEKKGFSKFGSYVGNGNADGTFVYTGFKPAFVLVKNVSTVIDWVMWDNKRSPYNIVTKELKPNLSNAEGTFDNIDMLSNGFKLRSSYTYNNYAGNTFIYMAFAESPLVTSNGLPANAR